MEEHCENCRFFVRNLKYAATVKGDCRIRAPIPRAGDSQSRVWPFVSGFDWCGEWRPEHDYAGEYSEIRQKLDKNGQSV